MANTNPTWNWSAGEEQAKPPGTLQRIADAAKHVATIANQAAVSPVAHALQEFAALPSEGINAVLGAPQRVNASHLANARANPGGVIGAATLPFSPFNLLHPAVRKQVGNDVYAALHPNDPTIENAAEHATGVDKLMTNDPRFRGKLRNFAVRTGFETATDPLTFTGAGTASAGEGALQRIGAAGTAALKSPNEAVRSAAKTFLTNVPEREGGFTPREIATVNSLRQRGITQARMGHTSDDDLLHSNRKALAAGTIPEPIRQRLLQEPFVYGTPEMREQAVALGYKPTAAESAKAPQNLLVYNLRENYDPHTGMLAPPPGFNDLLLGEEEKLRTPGAGFEKPQTGTASTETLAQRVERRLAAGRAAIRHRSTVASLQQHLGVGPEMASGLATEKKIGGFAPARAVSRAQVDALLSTGLPHMRNIGVAAYDVMGEPGVARGLQYFAAGVPKEVKGQRIFRVQQTAGEPEISPDRTASYFAYNPGHAKNLSTVAKNTGNSTITRIASARNPLSLPDETAGALLPAVAKKVGADLGITALTPHAEIMERLPGILNGLGVSPQDAQRLLSAPDGGLAAEERAAIELARSHGYDAIKTADEYIALHPSATRSARSLTERLEGGGAAHFGIRTPGKYSPARLLPRAVRKFTTGMLDRFDQAMRAARLEQLDRTNPELTELEKLDRVNQDLGAYNQRPHYVNMLSGIGGNFPQWHNYIVPTMVTRAALRQPGRVERLARVEQNANDTFLPNAKYRVTLGGPNDEGASAAADVARYVSGKGAQRYPKYFGGPSSLGPASLAFHPYGTFGQTLGEVGAGLIPFGNVGLSALTDLYKSPLPPAARALSELLGIYTQKRTKGSRARTATPATQQAPDEGLWFLPGSQHAAGGATPSSTGWNWQP